MICDDCDTVAHCTKYGCIPKQPTPEDEEFTRVETESKLRQHLIHHITHKTDPVKDFRERLAQAIEAMPFGDTAQSFAVFVRNFR